MSTSNVGTPPSTRRQGAEEQKLNWRDLPIFRIVALALIALSITALVYQIRVLTGHAAGPMLPITMTAACLGGAVALCDFFLSDSKEDKLQSLIDVAAAITIIALAAYCYRGVFSAKIFAKAALITVGANFGLSYLMGCCVQKDDA